MPYVFRKTDEMTFRFSRLRRKICIIDFVIDLLPKVETEQRTNIGRRTIEFPHRHVFDILAIRVVQEITHVKKTKKPSVVRSTSSIHNNIGTHFYRLDATLSRILMLLLRFTLPVTNAQSSQNRHDLLADLCPCTVTDETIRRTTTTDLILKAIDELLIGLTTVSRRDLSRTANKELSTNCAIVNRGVSA